MNTLEQLILGWECLGAAMRPLLRPAAWVVWLPLALARLGALAALAWCAHPLVSGVAAPVVAWLGGAGALHYPDLFRVLPAVHGRVDALLLATLGLWTVAASSIQVAASAGGARLGVAGCVTRATRRLPALFIATLPVLVIGWTLTSGVTMWLAARGSAALTVRLVGLVAVVALFLVRTYAAWLPPVVAAGGHDAREAWPELGRLSGRGFAAAFVITLVTTLPTLPLWFVLRSPGRWIDLGHPEWVALILACGVALTLLLQFVATVAITLAWRAIEEDPWLE
jgi:hypothetical protein